MSLPIIQRRLERAIHATLASSRHQRIAHKDLKRRGTYKKGVTRYTEHQTVKLTAEQMTKLRELSDRLRVEKGTLLRDALDMYLWFAEQERIEAIGEWAPPAALRHPRYKKGKSNDANTTTSNNANGRGNRIP